MLFPRQLFNSVVDEEAKKIALNLVGVVTYYGKHYSTFFYNTKRRLWIYFDDASVKQVGDELKTIQVKIVVKSEHSTVFMYQITEQNITSR